MAELGSIIGCVPPDYTVYTVVVRRIRAQSTALARDASTPLRVAIERRKRACSPNRDVSVEFVDGARIKATVIKRIGLH